ncbi:MAG: DM13 domain-containing protein [Pseudomonadota bacterium]
MKRFLLLSGTHIAALAAGFALGVYLLPILTAPPSPDEAVLSQMAEEAVFSAEIQQDLPGNDALHWGEGLISLTATQVIHEGRLAPGPDYRLYLVPEFVAHEDDFEPLKAQSAMIGEIDTFGGFILDLPDSVNVEDYTTALIWCEAFGEFIAAAQYRTP